jgi:hypothetical protein
MPTISKRIACHFAGENGRGVPQCWLTPEAARDMIEAGQAKWGNNKMSYLTLKQAKNELPKTARSLKPGLKVMEGFVAGNEGDIAIVEAWRYRWAA